MALSGTLETFSLPDVLRLLASTKKSGLLTLEGDRGIGRVWVDDGDIVAADSDGGAGEVDGVVFDLLRFADGSFEFDAGAEPNDAEDERRPVDAALDAAEALLEEWREIETVVPSLDVWVRIVPAIDDEVTIGPDQWRLLSRVGTGVDGHRIAGQLELGELDVCRELKVLIDRGLVEIDDEVVTGNRSVSGDDARGDLPAFQPPAFAAATIGNPDWTPPEALGPDAVTEDPWVAAGGAARSDEPWHTPEPEDADEPGETIGLDAASAVEDAVAPEEPVDEDPVDGDPVDEDTVDEDPVDEDAMDAEWTTETESTTDTEPVEAPALLVAEEAPVADLVEEAPDDFLTQLAHLSPKAAAAIEATASDHDQHLPDDDSHSQQVDESPSEGLVSSLVPGEDREHEPSEPLPRGDDAEPDTEPASDASDEDANQNLLLRFLSSTKQ